MESLKRKRFLQSFLGALGAKQIIWTSQDDNSIFGTVIYDETDPDERQDFVWHMTENNVPNDTIIDLLTYLTTKSLIDNDHLIVPVAEIEIPDIDDETRDKLFDELFRVSVDMIDSGKETDFYFIHQCNENNKEPPTPQKQWWMTTLFRWRNL